MPVAHVSVVGGVVQALALYQASQKDLQQDAAPSEQLGLAQLNAVSAYQNAVPRNVWYHRMRAEEARDKGQTILDRIAFWSAVPCARWRLRTLADQLEAVSDEIERWVA